MSCSAISCWQSYSVLNTSPMAIGVRVCWRIRRNDSCSSAGDRVLQPEQLVRLEGDAELRRLSRGQAMVDVVEQIDVPPDGGAHGLEQLRHAA